jgi:hypothetical protein
MGGNCEYTEYAVADYRKGVILQLEVKHRAKDPSVYELTLLRNITQDRMGWYRVD